jgi:hypothetical protein
MFIGALSAATCLIGDQASFPLLSSPLSEVRIRGSRVELILIRDAQLKAFSSSVF